VSPDEAGQLPLDLDVEYSERQRRAFAGRDPWDEAVKWREANPEATTSCSVGVRRRRRWPTVLDEVLRRALRKPWQRTTAVNDCPTSQQHDAVRLVRILLREFPELSGAFKTRRSRATRHELLESHQSCAITRRKIAWPSSC